MQIELLTLDQEDKYEDFLSSVKYSLLYNSLKYKKFLKTILKNSEDTYLVAYESGEIVGALPSFTNYNSYYGNIINSLPFYGSNGGIIVSPKASDQEFIKQSLLSAFHSLAIEKQAILSTLISNPLNPDVNFYETQLQYSLKDERIGQITLLPTNNNNTTDLENNLMSIFHYKTRNSIRKAEKSKINVSHSNALSTLEKLASLHKQNLEAIGGRYKSLSVFMSIRDIFTYDKDYRIYFAEKDNQLIAALLVFFYNDVAEYYTPATVSEFRQYQPMSLIVYEAMKEAVRRNCHYWNWGGTWRTQEGVYFFKSRWGTSDLPYYYYIHEYQKSSEIRQLTVNEVLYEYPYFYVFPFN